MRSEAGRSKLTRSLRNAKRNLFRTLYRFVGENSMIDSPDQRGGKTCPIPIFFMNLYIRIDKSQCNLKDQIAPSWGDRPAKPKLNPLLCRRIDGSGDKLGHDGRKLR